MVTQLQTLPPRVEVVEARVVDLRTLAHKIKESVPPSAEHMVRELKNAQASLAGLKADIMTEINELRANLKSMDDDKRLGELEERTARR